MSLSCAALAGWLPLLGVSLHTGLDAQQDEADSEALQKGEGGHTRRTHASAPSTACEQLSQWQPGLADSQ